ncbi:MAG: GAF domain-containing protein [Chloroflexi bacterium]|nr:GAF domain-containing protein [Chloroflexota bacterium]
MNNPVTHQPAQEEERHKRNALVISLTTGIAFAIVTAFLGPIAYRQNGLDGLWGVVLTGVVSLAGFIGALQIIRGRATVGAMILVVTILVVSCILPFLAQGQGLALAAIILVLVAAISSSSLPNMWTRRSLIMAFVTSTFIVAADLFLPDVGIPTNPLYTNVIAIIMVLGYAVFILRNFGSYALQTKIIISFILITIVPVGVLSIVNNWFSTQALQEKSETQLTSLANIAADTVDDFITIQIESISVDAKQLSLLNYLANPSSADEEKNASQTLLSLTRKNSVFIRSMAILNDKGINVLDTFEDNKGRDESLFPYFVRPSKDGLPYVSNIVFRGDKPSVYFSAPIKNLDGQIVGVLRVEYYAEVFQSIARSLLNPDDRDTIISLIDTNTYLRIGYTGDRDNLFKSYKDFTEMELVAMQSDGRLPSNPLRDTDGNTVAGIDNLQQQKFFFSYFQSLDTEAINTGVFLTKQPWVALVSQPTDVYLAPVRNQNKINTLTSLLLVFLSVAAGFITSQILVSPLSVLTKAAEKIALGDLNARAEVRTKDEIGTLAGTFNHMAGQLSQTLTGLEQRVAERTADLEFSRQQSVRRANELQSIGEISKIIAAEQKLETLLPLVTRLVSESLGFYHTGIFLVDSTNQFAVLQASNSVGGQNMLKRGHKLEVGGSGIVGYVAKSGTPRISLDVGQDAVYFNNPDLPNTRSEIALPLKVRDRIVGVLDVQSEKPGAFTENDANTLGILADQVAIALENARLFTQTQQALSEAQALNRQNLWEGWKTFSRETGFIGYQQSLTSGKKLTQVVETDEIRQAMNRGEALVFHADGITQEASIVVPIKLRGQIIGTINVKAPAKNRQWTTDETNLAERISERLSIALENARLIQESQRQALKEQQISEVTGKIGASINLKNVLQTAVEELGRAMPGSEVMIQFKSDDK